VLHQGGRNPAADCGVPAGETDNCNHSVIRIAQTKIGHTLTYDVDLFSLSGRGQHQDGDVSIGRGQLVAIDIDEIERIDRSA